MNSWLGSDELSAWKRCLICLDKELRNRFDYTTVDKPCLKCQKDQKENEKHLSKNSQNKK